MIKAIEFATALGSGVYNLEFTKLDGTIRKMQATRATEFIPGDKHPKTNREISDEQTAVPVFDTELNEWRSVIVNNVSLMEKV